jgi:TPR repeat protein|tara:strand:+ start:4446 stop:5063 length:618 start_codon:yes stop_codon:yes gene_type:complete
MKLTIAAWAITFIMFSPIAAGQVANNFDSEQLFEDAVKSFENEDFQTAVELFTVLAEQGESTSQRNLSLLYFKGLGSPMSYKRALYWAWRSALAGNEAALELVDDIRELVTDGLVDVVSQEIVAELTDKAMAGDRSAPERLGKTYFSLFVEPDFQMAYIWLLISQAYGNQASSEMLAEIESLLKIEDRVAYQDEATETFLKIKSN